MYDNDSVYYVACVGSIEQQLHTVKGAVLIGYFF